MHGPHKTRRRRRTGITQDDYAIEDRGYETPCWIWSRGLTGGEHGGYGKVKIGGRTLLAHRVMWEQSGRDRAEVLDHLCEQPACINPEHLRAGTQADNVRRGALTRLTREQADLIRRDSRLQRVIAAEYGISPRTVSKIKLGQRWA